jgi:predicted Rossmann fold flavoprotein
VTSQFQTIITGAGPAGLFAAININLPDTAVIEKNPCAGKKLLISGSGQCNFTHSGNMRDFLNHYGSNSAFIKTALKTFTNHDIVNFFLENRCRSVTDKNGKIFPESMQAADILNILIDKCNENNIRMIYATPVIAVEQTQSGFLLKTACTEYLCNCLVIATGGLSYPTTGSTGDGYLFAKQLGHTIVPPKPALSPVYISDSETADLAGVSLKHVALTLCRNSKPIKTIYGDIGFTHNGLSGPGILDLSRYVENNDIIQVNLTGLNIEEFKKSLIEASVADGKTTLPAFLRSYAIPRSLVKTILSRLDIPAETNLANVTKEMRKRLAYGFCAQEFTIKRTGGFDTAMATCGGVSLCEVNPATMESLLVKNLYFAGELLDVDGDTGGYNIQAAFSTGFCAASAINRKLTVKSLHA